MTSARQGDALLLAARELLGQPVGEVGKTNPAQCRVDPACDLDLGNLPHFKPERDILRHRHVRKEGIVLENETHIAFGRWQACHVASADKDAARRDIHKAPIIRNMVVFPQPEGPRKVTSSPSSILVA